MDVDLTNITLDEIVSELRPFLGGNSYMYRDENKLKILFNNSDGKAIHEHLQTTRSGDSAQGRNKQFIAVEKKPDQGAV